MKMVVSDTNEYTVIVLTQDFSNIRGLDQSQGARM